MIIFAIIIGVLILASIILCTYISERCDGSFVAGVFIGAITIMLMIIEICLIEIITEKPTPSAIDVYRGNTELEITSVNGVPTDSVVVYKDRIK